MAAVSHKGYTIAESPSGFKVIAPDGVEIGDGFGTAEMAKKQIDAYLAEGEPTSEDLKSVEAGATGIVPPGTGKA
jgi:hypothetical protein